MKKKKKKIESGRQKHLQIMDFEPYYRVGKPLVFKTYSSYDLAYFNRKKKT